MEFGANYPYEDATPFVLTSRQLGQYKGSFGQRLSELPAELRMDSLPPYARTAVGAFPKWKKEFIRQNREFYAANRSWIDPWLPRLKKFPPSLQKFEWNCKGWKRDIWSTIIQFRASGVRVKRPTTAPSLVAMTTTQVPIIGWERRFMTPTECARLQDLGSLISLPASLSSAYRALGNAVNARLVELVAANLFSIDHSLGNRRLAKDRESLNA
jgi:DNA (cytosine-5)-methyltransferase 1